MLSRCMGGKYAETVDQHFDMNCALSKDKEIVRFNYFIHCLR